MGSERVHLPSNERIHNNIKSHLDTIIILHQNGSFLRDDLCPLLLHVVDIVCSDVLHVL